MKLLTNIRFYKVAGISQTLVSFANYIKQNTDQNVTLVGVDVVNDAIYKNSPKTTTVNERNFKLITLGVSFTEIGPAIKDSKTLCDI